MLENWQVTQGLISVNEARKRKQEMSALPVVIHPYYRRHDYRPDLAAFSVAVGILATAIVGFLATVLWLTKVL